MAHTNCTILTVAPRKPLKINLLVARTVSYGIDVARDRVKDRLSDVPEKPHLRQPIILFCGSLNGQRHSSH